MNIIIQISSRRRDSLSDINNTSVRKQHNLILEDRKKLTLSGVRDVEGFDEQAITLLTELGELALKGEGMHIINFSKETGELSLEGVINSLSYSESSRTEGGILSRLFR